MSVGVCLIRPTLSSQAAKRTTAPSQWRVTAEEGCLVTTVQRWTFVVPTALGITQSTYEIAEDGLHFESDDPMGRQRDAALDADPPGLHGGHGRHGRARHARPAGLGAGADRVAAAVAHRGRRQGLHARAAAGRRPRCDRRGAAGASGRRLARRPGCPSRMRSSQLEHHEGSWGTLKVVGIVLAVLAMLVLLIIWWACCCTR